MDESKKHALSELAELCEHHEISFGASKDDSGVDVRFDDGDEFPLGYASTGAEVAAAIREGLLANVVNK